MVRFAKTTHRTVPDSRPQILPGASLCIAISSATPLPRIGSVQRDDCATAPIVARPPPIWKRRTRAIAYYLCPLAAVSAACAGRMTAFAIPSTTAENTVSTPTDCGSYCPATTTSGSNRGQMAKFPAVVLDPRNPRRLPYGLRETTSRHRRRNKARSFDNPNSNGDDASRD